MSIYVLTTKLLEEMCCYRVGITSLSENELLTKMRANEPEIYIKLFVPTDQVMIKQREVLAKLTPHRLRKTEMVIAEFVDIAVAIAEVVVPVSTSICVE